MNTEITPFAARVYAAVSLIPLGETRTYAQVAVMIGAPGSARAVGNALRHNPTPIEVPCHRVVRADGRTGGYMGEKNSERKRELLREEGVG